MASPPTGLRPYAARPEHSRGRRYREPEHPYRSCYERDRDRIIHSRAFRRLEYKTQVFPNYEGDHFRTRLTHTIEVAQLARTVARVLGLESTLAEAIALAHDLGHPPFGHIGEEALDELVAGGFEHNRQTLRIVDRLEERYAAFPGLNLTYELREGIAKHATRYDRFQEEELAEFDPRESPLLEAQIIDLVDSIAYNVHDVDDGVEAHVLDVEALVARVPLFRRIWEEGRDRLPGADARGLFNETVRRMIDLLVTDLIESTSEAIAAADIRSVDDVRACREPLARHSPGLARELEALGDFLFENLYRSPRVDDEMDRGRRILRELFEAYCADHDLLPPRHRARFAEVGENVAIADYVAGMTDRFVLREHARLVVGAADPPAPIHPRARH